MNSNLDQHFMVDKNIIKNIIKYSKLKKNEKILEIGAGKGQLTKELAKISYTIAIEKDPELLKHLKIPNTEIHTTDAIKFLKTKPKFDKLIANIPYSISEPLLNELKHHKFKLAILTVGKKLAQKLLGKKETKISITMPLFFKIKLLEEVPKSSFNPKPRTTSAIIQLKPRLKLSKNEKALKDFLLQEDKLAKNALRETLIKFYNLTKKTAKTQIKNFNKNTKQLSLEEIKKVKEIIETQ